MANSQNIWAWSTDPANNDDADSAITWVELQDPGTVNNSARAMMAAQKRMANAQSGNVTVGSGATVNDITIGTGQNVDTTHQTLGFRVCFKAAATNTGAVTVAVDGMSAVAVKSPTNEDLGPGAIFIGGIYDIAFDGTNYKLLNPSFGPVAELTSTDPGASGPVLSLYHNSATPAASDSIGIINFYGEDNAGNKQLYAQDVVQISDPTSGSEDSSRFWSVSTAGVLSTELGLRGSALFPVTHDGLALGDGDNAWSDAFFASGAVLNFGAGDVTVTHSANTLTVANGTLAVTNNLSVVSAHTTPVVIQNTNATDANPHVLLWFQDGTSQNVGSITVNGFTNLTTYNESSDGRLKDVIGSVDDAGTIIDQLDPVYFTWKRSGTRAFGFIAQDLAKVLPSAVTPGNDKQPGEDGFIPWMMRVGGMEALLIAEIKALRARVAALEAGDRT